MYCEVNSNEQKRVYDDDEKKNSTQYEEIPHAQVY